MTKRNEKLEGAIGGMNSDLQAAARLLSMKGAASAVQLACVEKIALSTAYFCMNELVFRGLAAEIECRDSNGHADFILVDEEMAD